MSRISRFTSKAVTLAKNVVGGRGEVAAPEGGGGFADYALVSLHWLRIYLDEPYRNALDLLSEMPHILAGESAELTFDIRRDGEPVSRLDPYLGALGHLVALREGDLAYLHVHPEA